MTDTEKLYETLGELLFVVAKADGIIQTSEKEALQDLLKNHGWAKEVNWSFNYEEAKNNSIDDVYGKVIAVCSRIGPSPIYNEFIDSMEIIAKADDKVDDKVDDSEQEVINSFSKDLIERFRKDILKL